jgi:hypothetical protein
MTQPIQRDGSWWSKTDSGWMRWNEDAQSWEAQPAGPPPPPPPPPGAAPTVPMSTAAATQTVQRVAPTQADRQAVPTAAPVAQSPTKPRGNKLVAIVTAVVVLAGVGTGGYFLLKDDGDDPATTARSGDSTRSDTDANGGGTGGGTKEEFIAQADALCAEASAKFGELTEPATPEEAGPFLTEAIAINETLYADLTAVEAPAGDNGEAAKVLAGLEAITGQMKILLAAIEAKDGEAIQANYDKLGVVTDEANAAAAAYGLVACAS